MSITDQFFEDVQAPRLPSDDEARKLSDLVQRQLTLEKEVIDLDSRLSAKKKELAQVQEVELPAIIQQFGISKIELQDGSKITVKQEYYATIKEEYRHAAFSWLEAKGHADLIKHDVVMSFTRGQDDDAQKAIELLEENNLVFRDEKKVHPQTLKAFVKEQIEAGNELPLETFSVFVKQVAKISLEKK